MHSFAFSWVLLSFASYTYRFRFPTNARTHLLLVARDLLIFSPHLPVHTIVCVGRPRACVPFCFRPVSASALSQLFQEGEVDGMTVAWTTGMGEWKPLREVAHLLYRVAKARVPSAPRDATPTSTRQLVSQISFRLRAALSAFSCAEF